MATIIRMPGVLADMNEGVVAAWQVTEGSEVAKGTVLVEIETEKAVIDYEAEEAGVIGKLLVADGESVLVGEPIAILLAHADEEYDPSGLVAPSEAGSDAPGAGNDAPGPGDAPRAGDAPGPGEESGEPAADTVDRRAPDDSSSTDAGAGAGDVGEGAADTAPGEEAPGESADGPARGGRIFISPIARKLAKDRGVDPADLSGTGPNGRITRRDVESYVAPPTAEAPVTEPAAQQPRTAPAPTSTADVEEIPVRGMRRAIARRLTESKATVPHFYVTEECRVDDLLVLRRRVNDAQDTKISLNVFVLKAVAAAMRAVPEANAVWGEDVIRRYQAVDVAVAVATDGGLVTPVVRGLEAMPIGALSSAVSELAERARAGRLKQDEIEGGTFTVSNLGMYGTPEFSAIINPPHSGILAVGAAVEQPVVEDGQIVVGTTMRCTLSADHRVVDGAVGAAWMQAFRKAIESPFSLLV